MKRTLLATLMIVATSTYGFCAKSVNMDNYRTITITNEIPGVIKKMSVRPTISHPTSWREIKSSETDSLRPNDQLEIQLPEEPCLYELEVEVEVEGQTFIGKYNLNVCNNSNPQLR